MTVQSHTSRPIEAVRHVRLPGEYDVSNSCRIIDALLGDSDADTVVGDLVDTTFMDSTSVRALLEARARLAAEGRELRLQNPSPTIRTLFEVSGLVEHFGLDVEPDRQRARFPASSAAAANPSRMTIAGSP
jgi:anti-anti-sigma factor